MSLEDDCRRELLAELEQGRMALPTLPDVAVRIREVVHDENASAGDVSAVISTDPALTTRLLHVVNSPMYRGTRTIENVRQAVTRLGMDLVRNLALSLVMKQLFHSDSPRTLERMRELWDHSTQVAAISHVLSAQFTRVNPEQAMLAGLIHDIGAVPILQYASRTPALLGDPQALDGVLRQLHASLGGAMLKHWQFPLELVEAVSNHEDLSRSHSGPPDMVDVVTVANLHSRLGTDHPLAAVSLAEVPACAQLGLGPEISMVSLEGAVETCDSVQQMLNG